MRPGRVALWVLALLPASRADTPHQLRHGPAGHGEHHEFKAIDTGRAHKFNDEIAAAKAVSAVAGQSETCGPTRVFDKVGRMVRNPGMKPECQVLMSTNCSVSYAMKCPAECPYIVPHHSFACFFACVRQDECSSINPDRALPDHSAKMCRKCPIEGCEVCKLDRHRADDSLGGGLTFPRRPSCKRCHDSFELSEDGRSCTFWLDRSPYMLMPLRFLGALVIGIVLLGVVWACVAQAPRTAGSNLFRIMRSREHRQMCKVLSWTMDNPRRLAERISLLENVHTNNILGVGLALFYNNACFTVVTSMIFFIVAGAVYSSSDASQALANFELRKADLLPHAQRPDELAPAVVVSRLAVCQDKRVHSVHEALRDFAEKNFLGIGILYVLLFAWLLVFARWQKKFKADFDSKHATMADYAFEVSGLPAAEVDEEALRKWFEDEARKLCPGTRKRPPQEIKRGNREADESRPVPDSEIEVYAVSILYDYRKKWAEVDEILHQMCQMQEIEADPGETVEERTELAHLKESHCREVRGWFENKEIRSTGKAFVVFKYVDDLEEVQRKVNENPKCFVYPGSSQPLEIANVHSEPPSVCWWNASCTSSEKKANAITTCTTLATMVGCLQVCIVFPYVWYFVMPYTQIGNAASGTSLSVAGQVLGILNMLLGMQIWGRCFNIGFQRKETLDTLVLFLNTGLVLLNTCLNMGITAYMIFSQNKSDTGFASFFAVANLYRVSVENSVARSIYLMMMPGTFFVGFFMTILMAGIWPMIWNTFLMKLIYVWGALPECLLKVFRLFLPWAPDGLQEYPQWRAEKALEPMEIQIGDYSHLIVIPTVCATMLFFVSPYTQQMYKMMTAWSIFYYFFMRYIHFRFCKAAYFTTDIIDNFVTYLWALPMGVVGAAWYTWGVRSATFVHAYGHSFDVAMLCLSFIGGGGAWILVYTFVVDPFTRKKLPEEHKYCVEEVKRHNMYDWLNCNPVYVLKCAYVVQDGKGKTTDKSWKHPLAYGEEHDKVRFFSVGKEYLFCKKQNQNKARVEAQGRSGGGEIEYWVSGLFWLMDWSTGMFHKKVAAVDFEVDDSLKCLLSEVKSSVRTQMVHVNTLVDSVRTQATLAQTRSTSAA